MADVLGAVSIALPLAGKVRRNLPAVYDPVVFASLCQSDPSNSATSAHIVDERGSCSNNIRRKAVSQ
jgi:hypothetical protein